ERHRRVNSGQFLAAVVGEAWRASTDEQQRLHERDELVAGRRTEKTDARIAPVAVAAVFGQGKGRHRVGGGLRRLFLLGDGFSFSSTKFTSSIAILSESAGSSSRICRVCRHVSHPIDCVKNSTRTFDVISLNDARSLSWSAGERRPIQ